MPPSDSSSPFRYSYARTGRAGLGNELFAVARAFLYARESGAVFLPPVWLRPRVGPLLRGEHDKRMYSQAFQRPGLGMMARRSLALSSGQLFTESGALLRRGSRRSTVRVFSGMGRFFEEFEGCADVVREFLVRVSRQPVRPTGFPAALHVRLGDFGRSGAPGQRNSATPISWFVTQAEAAVGALGSAAIFSDGTDAELSPLLAIPGVERRPSVNALVDMLAMSSSRVVVGSGSTFSAWGAFLGRSAFVVEPGKNFYLPKNAQIHEADDPAPFGDLARI